MLSHLSGGFVRCPPFQELEHLPWQAREYFAAEADSTDDPELPNFDIQVVHARFAGVGFELLKDRDGRGCDHSQQFVYPGTDGRWRTVGDLAVHILVKAIKRGAHHAFQFALGRQFDAQRAQAQAGRGQQQFIRICLVRAVSPKPGFERLLIGGRGESPAGGYGPVPHDNRTCCRTMGNDFE